MAFPAIIPSTRTYEPGDYPQTAHLTLIGDEVRVRHSNQSVDAVLRLSFLDAETTVLQEIVAHYGVARGDFHSFALPPETFSGADNTDTFTLTGHRWIYLSLPDIEDIPIPLAASGDAPSNRHNIIVELGSVPPEPVVALGARLRVTVSVAGGDAYDGDAYWKAWREQNVIWYPESFPEWWAN